jgi:hypothetical protein
VQHQSGNFPQSHAPRDAEKNKGHRQEPFPKGSTNHMPNLLMSDVVCYCVVSWPFFFPLTIIASVVLKPLLCQEQPIDAIHEETPYITTEASLQHFIREIECSSLPPEEKIDLLDALAFECGRRPILAI